MTRRRHRAVMVVLAGWALAFAGGIAAALLIPPRGDGFTRGLNRLEAVAAWHLLAGLLALACLVVARGLRGWPGRLARLPALVLGAQVLALTGTVGWALLRG